MVHTCDTAHAVGTRELTGYVVEKGDSGSTELFPVPTHSGELQKCPWSLGCTWSCSLKSLLVCTPAYNLHLSSARPGQQGVVRAKREKGREEVSLLVRPLVQSQLVSPWKDQLTLCEQMSILTFLGRPALLADLSHERWVTISRPEG